MNNGWRMPSSKQTSAKFGKCQICFSGNDVIDHPCELLEPKGAAFHAA